MAADLLVSGGEQGYFRLWLDGLKNRESSASR
jgi:hypothetical protein